MTPRSDPLATIALLLCHNDFQITDSIVRLVDRRHPGIFDPDYVLGTDLGSCSVSGCEVEAEFAHPKPWCWAHWNQWFHFPEELTEPEWMYLESRSEADEVDE